MFDILRAGNAHFLLVLLFLGTSQFFLAAETTVLHLYHAPDPDPLLEEILYLSAGTELREEGFSSTRSGEIADYIMITEYTFAGDTVVVKHTLYQPGEPRRELSQTVYSLPLNYDFDSFIGLEMHRLFERANLIPEPSGKAEIYGLFPTDRPFGPDGAVMKVPEDRGSDTVGEAPANPEDQEPPETQEDLSLEKSRETVPAVFGLSASLSGLMLFGPITEYFHYGGAVKITAGVSWPGEAASFSLGLEAGGTRIFNDEGVVGGPLYISTGGAVFALGTGRRAPYRITGKLSGGAAIITVAGGAEGVLSKTVPYGEAGIHALFPLGKGFSLGGEMSFRMIFDDDLIIFGASPAFMLRKEF